MVSICWTTQRRKRQSPFLFVYYFVITWSYRSYERSVANALQSLVNVRLQHNRMTATTTTSVRSQQSNDILGVEHRHRYLTTRNARSTDGDDFYESPQQPLSPGMADAFRQLESLKSLDDPEEYIPAPDKINIDTALENTSTILSSSAVTSVTVSPEQDFAVYKNMLQEIEEDEGAASYAEVLDELGGSALQIDDIYSQIITELGGTKMGPSPSLSTSSSSSSSSPFSSWATKSIPNEDVDVRNTKSDGVTISNEQLLDDALKEAMNEVQLNHPQLNERSILNDKEMMQEIETIFDRGNAQLIESLEEIRREQVSASLFDP